MNEEQLKKFVEWYYGDILVAEKTNYYDDGWAHVTIKEEHWQRTKTILFEPDKDSNQLDGFKKKFIKELSEEYTRLVKIQIVVARNTGTYVMQISIDTNNRGYVVYSESVENTENECWISAILEHISNIKEE